MKQIVMRGDIAKIYFYDVIGYGDSEARTLAKKLEGLESQGIKKFEVHLGSPGGILTDGIAIYNLLRERKTTIFIDSIAASSASLIAMSGRKIKMHETAFLMIHNPSIVASGEEKDMKKAQHILALYRTACVKAYMARTSVSKAQIEMWMDEETWFNAEEALQYGFIDEIITSKEAKEENVNNQSLGDSYMKKFLINLLKLKADTRDDDIQVALSKYLDKKDSAINMLKSTVLELQEKVKGITGTALETASENGLKTQVEKLGNMVSQLKNELNESKANLVVENAVAIGKILPSQKADYLALAMKNPAEFSKDMEKRPVVFDPKKGAGIEGGDKTEPVHSNFNKAVAQIRKNRFAAKSK